MIAPDEDLVPDRSRDDSDEGWGEAPDPSGPGGGDDERFLRDVPPHHAP